MMAADLKPRLDEIWRKPTITLADTRPEAPEPSWICGCAEILGLIGPNGSGKTTFFNVVTGIYGADEGRVTFDGVDISYGARID